jgi:hypothetical protein
MIFSFAWGQSCPRFNCLAEGRAWQGDCLLALETAVNRRFITGSSECKTLWMENTALLQVRLFGEYGID